MNKLFYKFPVIQTLDDVLPAINGHDEFFVRDNGDHYIVNYLYNDPSTFLCPNEDGISKQESLYRAIRKECRGLIFDADGKIISRPYHKFHNLNERPEYNEDVIDMTQPHSIMEKLDGSMIRFFKINGRHVWGTKMGHTYVSEFVESFIKKNKHYEEFSSLIYDMGYTPIFEFCSRKNRIVIDYPNDRLVLTAIRHNITGEYINIHKL